MQKFLVVLICLTFSVPSQCCDFEQTCCVDIDIVDQKVSCCQVAKSFAVSDTIEKHDRPCCEDRDDSQVYVISEAKRLANGQPYVLLPSRTLECSSETTFNNLNLSSDSVFSGRELCIRLQFWLC